MAQKFVEIDDLGQAVLIRRRGVKHIRLSFNSQGLLRITTPYFLPYSVGISFAKSKKDWVLKHRPIGLLNNFFDGQVIGKYHRIIKTETGETGQKLVKVKGNSIFYKDELTKETIILLEKAVNKCLKDEAIELLPSRLNKLADRYGYKYRDVKIKKMHSRWGSCSNLKLISLSYYLVQLPWELIDYVLVHELVHTQHMNHGANFWATLETHKPNVKSLRKELKAYNPNIFKSIS